MVWYFFACFIRKRSFVTNKNILIPLSLKPNGVYLEYFILRLFWSNRIQSLKYQRSTILGFKDWISVCFKYDHVRLLNKVQIEKCLSVFGPACVKGLNIEWWTFLNYCLDIFTFWRLCHIYTTRKNLNIFWIFSSWLQGTVSLISSD